MGRRKTRYADSLKMIETDPELEILIREADREDAALIAELTRASWADKVAPTSSGHRETAEAVLSDLERGGAYILSVNEKPSASVRWRPIEGEVDVWEIRRLGVIPMYRSKNLSLHLIEAVINRAMLADVGELRLSVRADQPRLIDFYATFGFETAPELDYYDTDSDFQLLMMRRYFYR